MHIVFKIKKVRKSCMKSNGSLPAFHPCSLGPLHKQFSRILFINKLYWLYYFLNPMSSFWVYLFVLLGHVFKYCTKRGYMEHVFFSS